MTPFTTALSEILDKVWCAGWNKAKTNGDKTITLNEVSEAIIQLFIRDIIGEDDVERYRELGRKSYIRNQIKNRERRKEHYVNNKPQYQAHEAVQRAIQKGLLVRLPCIICNEPKSDGHHEDYSKQLDVIWLCRKHHQRRHRDARTRLAQLKTKEEI